MCVEDESVKKGQLSIINIIFFVVLVMIVGIATAIIGPFLDDQQAANNYSATTNTIMNMIVPLIWLGAIITFFLYVTPVRTNQF
jgi:quinol-cytochrome oxidoreductase complex cytochrome b subunit